MKQSLSGESIRLTNQTARALRASAKKAQFQLHMTALVLSLLLAALAVYLGMRRIIYVPVLLMVIIALDVVLVKRARSRFLQLSGLAICTEAAVRIMRGERAEQQRILQAERNLNEIHRDLQSHAAPRRDEDEDDDLYGGTPQTAAYVGAMPDAVPDVAPEPSAPPRRRRRQARLQVLQGEDAR